MMETNYKKLMVWKKSLTFVKNLYKILDSFPDDEKYWLISQMKRAAISIPSNIAEWAWRNSKIEFKQFLHIAKWSCYELETQIIIAKELWYIKQLDYGKLSANIEELIKMLQWLIKSKSI